VLISRPKESYCVFSKIIKISKRRPWPDPGWSAIEENSNNSRKNIFCIYVADCPYVAGVGVQLQSSSSSSCGSLQSLQGPWPPHTGGGIALIHYRPRH
jgi:hypothetical protein